MVESLGVEEAGDAVIGHAAHRYEVFLVLVLYHHRDEVIYLACLTEEYLTLAILCVFLYVECYGLCNTEVLGGLWHGDAHFLGHLEEMVNGMTRGEYDSRVIGEIDLLITEFLRCKAFDLDERTEDEFYIKLTSYLVIWRVVACGFWLRNQNLFYHRLS